MNTSWMGDLPPYFHNLVPTWTLPEENLDYHTFSFYPYDNFSSTYIGEIQKLMLEIPFTPITEDFEPQLIDLSKEELVDMIEELKKEVIATKIESIIELVNKSKDKFIGDLSQEDMQNYLDISICIGVMLSQVKTIKELQESNDFLQSQRLKEHTIINSLMERLDKISRIINEEAYI